MRKRLKACLITLMFAATPLAATAENNDTVTGDKAADMVMDLVVVRPLGLAATVIGTVLTVVALPFTIPSGSVESSARELMVSPAEYTFNRPLGEFHRCGADRHPCGVSER
jgi:PhoPQ-activated pathogenicity-related protein